MDFAKLAEERYSVRKFTDQAVEKEALESILRAGRIAPTAANRQPQRILVVNDAEGMEKLGKCTKYKFGQTAAFIVCADESAAWVRSFDGDNSGAVDAAIVTTHMMLQAADLGLGTTWIGNFDPAKVAVEFNLPDGVKPVAILPLGHPAADAEKSPKHFDKLPPEQVVFYGSFPSA